MSELLKTEKPTYEILIEKESAIKDGFLYLWVEKFWVNSNLKVRGSELATGYTLFPRGQCAVKFPVSGEELERDGLASVLGQMVSVLTEPFRTFVKIEDSQDSTRKEDF